MTRAIREHYPARGRRGTRALLTALPLVVVPLAPLVGVPPAPAAAATREATRLDARPLASHAHPLAKGATLPRLNVSPAAPLFVVTTTTDPASCPAPGRSLSLRCAITAANQSATTGAKTIAFAIPRTDTGCAPQAVNGKAVRVCVIQPTQDLPAVTANQVTIDGYSQTGARANTDALADGDNAILTVRLDGAQDTTSAQGLLLQGVGDVVQGLSVTGFLGNFSLGGIVPNGAGSVVQGDFLGLTPTGGAAPNSNGVFTTNRPSPTLFARIGGVVASARNVISGNTNTGLSLESPGGTVQGNLIGVTPAGSAALGNGIGVFLFGNNGSLHAAIGGTAAGAGNVIGGNRTDGVLLLNDSGSTVAGNDIGTNARGTAALPNAGDGVQVKLSINGEIIGGTGAGARNVIGGNTGNGIELNGGSGTLVQGNWIGIGGAMAPLANAGNGVYLHSLSAVNTAERADMIGGTASGAGNTIANNGGNGVLIGSSPTDSATGGATVRGNAIYNNPLGISLNGEYPASCPNGPSSGPNDFFPCPTIAFATTGAVRGVAAPNSQVDVYLATEVANDGGHGEGTTYLGTARADGTGTWSLALAAGRVAAGQRVTATATGTGPANAAPETSEFGANVTVFAPVRPAVYVANGANSAVHSYALGATGNAAPLGTLAGAATGLNGTGGLALDPAGDLFVANQGASSVTAYAPQASGNVAPIATIAGAHTGLSTPDALALDASGRLYAANAPANAITVYAAGANGDVAPLSTIAGVDTGLSGPVALTVDGAGHLWVANQGANSLTEYAAGASGDAAPVATVAGPLTALNHPAGLARDVNGDLLVANQFGPSITAYPPNASGDVAPLATIAGPATGLDHPYGLDVDTAGRLYVANGLDNTITEYAAGATGNATPAATISGSATGLAGPTGLAVAPPLSILTVSLPRARVGRRYTAILRAGEGASPYRWSLARGRLPAGLRLSASGVIWGRPTEMGRWRFTVRVTDSAHPATTARQDLSIEVASA